MPDAYDRLEEIFRSFDGLQEASRASGFEVVFPHPDYKTLTVNFAAASKSDHIRDFVALPELSPHLPGIRKELKPHRENFRHESDERWHHGDQVVYSLDLAGLARVRGDDLYGPILFVFGFKMKSQIKPDLGIRHVLRLNVARPPRPEITFFSPRAARPGSRVSVHGLNLLGAKEVLIGAASARDLRSIDPEKSTWRCRRCTPAR